MGGIANGDISDDETRSKNASSLSPLRMPVKNGATIAEGHSAANMIPYTYNASVTSACERKKSAKGITINSKKLPRIISFIYKWKFFNLLQSIVNPDKNIKKNKNTVANG